MTKDALQRIMTMTPPLETRLQVGALCLNAEGRVLLITSRNTGRWVIPKGWPMAGRTHADSALQEAWEEAGVKGAVAETVIGTYHYAKMLRDGRSAAIAVAVYPVAVTALADDFPEAGQRRRRWFRPRKAAKRVAEPELQALLAALPDPGPRTG